MGWGMTLTTSEPVTEEQIDAVVKDLPDEMKGAFNSKQSWGWSLQVDVSQEDSKHIRVSGAWWSVKCAEHFSKEFAKRLGKVCGCQVRRGKLSG